MNKFELQADGAIVARNQTWPEAKNEKIGRQPALPEQGKRYAEIAAAKAPDARPPYDKIHKRSIQQHIARAYAGRANDLNEKVTYFNMPYARENYGQVPMARSDSYYEGGQPSFKASELDGDHSNDGI